MPLSRVAACCNGLVSRQRQVAFVTRGNILVLYYKWWENELGTRCHANNCVVIRCNAINCVVICCNTDNYVGIR